MTVQLLSGGELVYEPWPVAGDWHPFSGNVGDYRTPKHSLLDPEYVWRTQRNVRTVIGYLARNFAQVRLLSYERDPDGNRERLPRDANLARSLSRPYPSVTEYDFAFHRMVDLSLWDRWAALKLYEPDGTVKLRRLPPRRWRFLRDEDDLPVGIRLRQKDDGDGYVDLSLDWLVWLDGYPIKSNGYSPMEFLIDLLTEESESSRHRIDMWRNGARISGVIERPLEAPKWEKPARDAFGRRWRAAYTYAGTGSVTGTRLGGTPILEDGMTFKPMKAITPEQGEQIESRRLSTAEVASAFFVAPELIGAREGTYSNVKAYREGLYSETLGPVFMQSQQMFDARFVPYFAEAAGADLFAEHNVAEKLKMSFEEQMEVLTAATGAPIMLRQEARRRLNLRDLPESSGADELVVPLNVLIGGQASAQDSTPDERSS